MAINKIYLDMDGVLTDFNKTVCKQFNLPYPPKEYSFFEPIRKQVDDFCNADFWEHLEWMLDGKEILQLVEYHFPLAEIYLLTCPMFNLGSWTGKYLWVKRELPNYTKRLIITPVPKEILADKSTLLIDDCDEKVQRFWDKGYAAILVPRFWNSLCQVKNSVQQVKACLEFITNNDHEQLNGEQSQ